MNEVTPWISDYFTNLATTYGSNYLAAPPVEKLRKCQVKKVLTPEPQDYCWVILSDIQHEVPGRIPKEVVDQCLKEAKRGDKITRHTGSLIDIRNFTPLFIRVEDGPSSSTTREVLALEIKRAKLRGATKESVWGSPKPLDSVPQLKEWMHELRNPDGNQDILKIRKKQQDDTKAAKQLAEPSEHSPDVGLHLQPATSAPVAALRKTDSTTPAVRERTPVQRYRRKWHKAVPGLNEFARRMQIPEDVRLKILEKQAKKEAEAKLRASGTVPTSRPLNVRGALEIGSSPPRLSPVPRATTPEEWPASPGGPKAIYDDHETEMSSDVDSSRLSSPVDIVQDTEMVEVVPQPEVIPETPQVPVDSQPRPPSPPPPAQPPRPRSPLPSSSNPHVQTDPNSSASMHTSIQAVSGSQLPSLENPPAWAPLHDESSGGPSFVLPWTQRDDPPIAVPKPNPEAHPSPQKQTTEPPSPEKQATKPPSPIKEPAPPIVSKPPQDTKTAAKKPPRTLAFGESVFQAIELAFQQGGSEETAPATNGPTVALPTPKVTVAQVPPPKPRSKPPSKVIQSSLPGPSPSPLDRLAEANHTESPVRRPFEVLNRKVPLPEVGPTRDPVRGRSENGVPTMVLIPASDETKVSSPLKQNSSSQPVQSSQSIPSSQRIPPSDRLPSSELASSSQAQHSAPQPDNSIAQDGDSVMVQVNETVADIENVQDHTGNTQSSLEYANTQDENRIAVDAEPQNLVDKPPEVVVVTVGAASEPQTSPHPQIAVIREVESQQSVVVEEEEVDELEDDSDVGDHRPVVKRKPKPASSKPSTKTAEQPKRGKPVNPAPSPKAPSKPTSWANSVVERAPTRSPLPPKPIVLIKRKRTPAIPVDERVPTGQKRRLQTPAEEGPIPQPLKRSRIHGHHAAQTTLLPTPRTPSPLPQEGQNSVVLNTSRSVKGKERAKGIKGLEKINTAETLEREESEVVKLQVKKPAPDTGSKRKPSDAFSARDNSREVKRQKVAEEFEQRKPKKQLSFVDPDKLKRPFRKPQVRKASPQRQVAVATTAKPAAAAQTDQDGRTSKYFNPHFYREPEYPQVATTTPEKEPPQRTANPKRDVGNKATTQQNGRDPGELRPRNDSRKASTSNSDRPARAQHPKPTKKVEKNAVVSEPQFPTSRKLGSFAPDLNPPPLPGFPGGRLMNKQLRDILIRTGKVRVREAKAAELNRNGR